ncbi:serine hydrolase domain-containing protein [Streptomyces canus]|uniref:serine hydrolase domain-containing protein n=1 Tax=Streptomyces canus TaxID=58343 RepID=UPI00371DE7DB
MRDLRRRSILAGALAVPLTAGLPISSATAHSACAPDGKALRAALAGLPDADATAALVRVGGTGGSWRGSSGVHDLESERPADPGARFRAGSTTKVVTAAAVLRLVAEGRIDLNTPVQSYLPGLLGSRFRPVTVRHLLNHTSGIPAGDGLGTTFEEVYAHRFDTLTPQRVAASAGVKQPEFCPGKQAVRRAEGTTEFVDVTEWNQADRFAAGDMISTTADLERLLTGLFRGRIVPRPQLREVFSVPSDITGASYSAGGLQRFQSDGKVYWVKSGGRYGYNSAIAATRDLSRTVVYSVNSTDAKSEDANPVIVRIITAALK